MRSNVTLDLVVKQVFYFEHDPKQLLQAMWPYNWN